MLDDPRIFSPEATAPYVWEQAQTPPDTPLYGPSEDLRSRGLPLGYWLGLLGANVADSLSTTAAINRGGQEANPVLKGVAGNPFALLATKIGAATLQALLFDKIHRSHPRAGKIGAVVASSIPAGAAIWNSRQR